MGGAAFTLILLGPVLLVDIICPPCLIFTAMTGVYTIQSFLVVFPTKDKERLYDEIFGTGTLRHIVFVWRLLTWLFSPVIIAGAVMLINNMSGEPWPY